LTRGARPLAFVVTCEHGGNRIPAAYRRYFKGKGKALESHHGYDAGALALARDLAHALRAQFFHSTVSRLLVDLNRSPRNSRLHGEAIRHLPKQVREDIRARYYAPFRQQTYHAIETLVAQGFRVIHVSSHSFTPVLDGEVRNADVGLLYDPARQGEKTLADRWQAALETRAPGLRVRRNYPYLGKSDGHATWLRRHFGAGRYLGLELEVNQRFVVQGGPEWKHLRAGVVAALLDAVASSST
jgi:predicted N-formylglutamate amidohydrolase